MIILVAGRIVLADTEGGPFSYTVQTADKRHIFVNLTSHDSISGLVERGVTYHASGMYLNDGSATPLWTVDWQRYVYLPNGGDYVVRKGNWARFSGTYEEEALSFVLRGNVLKTYTARDLVVFPWLLPHSVSHYKWVESCSGEPTGTDAVLKVGGSEYANNAGVLFADNEQAMEVTSFQGDRLKFDLSTGDIVSAAHPARTIVLATFGLFLFAYSIFRYLTASYFPAGARSVFSNLAVGLIVTSLILVVPTVAAGFTGFVSSCTDYLPMLFDRLCIAFFLFPAWCSSFFGIAVGESFSLNMLSVEVFLAVSSFWLSCIVALSLIDRCFAAVLAGRNGRPSE